MEPQIQNTTEEKSPSIIFQVTPFSKYLALFLFIVLPFIGGFVGYNIAPERLITQEVQIVAQTNERDKKFISNENQSNDSEDVIVNLDKSIENNTKDAIQSYLNQKLSTIAVMDTPIPSVQIAVAADREGSVYCGYDNGPCHFFLQAYNYDYPRVKYLGTIDSKGVFVTSSLKFTSPTVFQFDISFSDAGTSIKQVWNFDINTGSSTKISEERRVSEEL